MASKKNSVDNLVLKAISAMKLKRGSKIPAISKWISANHKKIALSNITAAVKRLVLSGILDK